MEPNLEQLIADAIHQYVSQALGRELPIWAALYLLTTAIVAAVAAYLGSYLRKRAEQSVINANFGTALAQLREQTTATETIKAELTSQIEALKSVNERQRSFAVHQRERIIRHIDALFDSAAEVLSIADVCRRRTWTEGGDHAETQQRILSQISAMRLHIVALRDFNAIEDSVCQEVVLMLEAIRDRWDAAFGELAKKDPSFAAKFPAAAPYDGMRYVELGGRLLDKATELVDLIGSIPRKVQIPI
jgi:hypothetical protein